MDTDKLESADKEKSFALPGIEKNSAIRRRENLLRRAALLTLLLLFLCIPAGFLVPASFCWENGPVENFQAVLLFAYCLVWLVEAQRSTNPRLKLMMRGAGLFFLLLCGRELSWGRVFFPIGFDDLGPCFMRLNSIPGHQYINAAIGVLIAVTVYYLARYTPWKLFLRQLPFPWLLFFTTVICFIICDSGEHYMEIFLGKIAAQNIEELAETCFYFALITFAEYYRMWTGYISEEV